ncbi:EAL domain-containing protein [Marinomonas sp. C2222]|uniref:EAL domain-containing protein n=1 Tax=Marinomonas sargassi TaxID=2984494 RepID=A0ABT2YRL4_9GAMM|nr:GGDEF domain-containing response regulator [Marinomonas sargassi]MCV2402532.1 EAL domain-containing protein [Marinomonas sargassi]
MAKLRVLIIDDDTVSRLELRRALSHSMAGSNDQYNIDEVNCAQDALVKLESNFYDVLLVDYLLPGANGIDFLFDIKESTTGHNVTIIMISNHSDDDLIVESIDAGAHDFILKSDLSASFLKRSILQARKRYELEQAIHSSYQKVRQLAERDILTGLFNRYYFDEYLSHKLSVDLGSNKRFAIMVIDINNFKRLNDTHGHNVGDKLICAIGRRLSSWFGANEKVFRIGGDEFAFILDYSGSSQSLLVKGNSLVKALSAPFSVDGVVHHCSGSIGVSTFPQHGTSSSELVKCAEIAMYRAKSTSEHIRLYQDGMKEELLLKYSVETELKAANIEKDFSLQYQPIMKNDRVKGVEALVRWTNGTSTQRPDIFIPIAEESGVIIPLGKWIVEKAIQDILDYILWGDDFYLSINVSPRQLQDRSFGYFLIDCLERHQVSPSNLIVEITETAMLEDDETSLETIERLAGAGVQIAFDDFGTGYSSLSHLLKWPIDFIKVDKSLLDEIDLSVGSTTNTVLEGLALMLNKLELKTIAEGIERQEQADFCRKLGMEAHQGYLYSKPLDIEPLHEFLRKNSKIERLNGTLI